MNLVITSRINNEFNGFEEGKLFKLENGEIWIQDEYGYDCNYIHRPKVKIFSDDYRFYLQVEGMDKKVAVRRIPDYVQSDIVSDFKGWDGNTIFKLANGQVWQQAQSSHLDHYAYHPTVIIYNSGSGYKMKVEGIAENIFVKRIK